MQVNSVKNIVFYFPGEISSSPERGSAVRVSSMLTEFKNIGCRVIQISGTQKERISRFNQLFEEVEQGLKVDFVYAENTNSPILYGPNKQYSNPLIEYQNLLRLASLRVPMGIFYRDVYWRFPLFNFMTPFGTRLALKLLLLIDWLVYQKCFDIVFLPSLSMSKYLPLKYSGLISVALPPGCNQQAIEKVSVGFNSLKLIYVGGVTTDVYDLSNLLNVLGATPKVKLTICCRESEWGLMKNVYESLVTKNIEIVHKSGDQLVGLYRESDISIMAVEYSDYRQFAMPVKLFEAIGYGLPIITLNQKAVAEYVKEFDLGWVVESFSELKQLLRSEALVKDYLKKRRSVELHKDNVTWAARVSSVCDSLMEIHK